ncbi:MAG: hypothetical protein M1834_004593 [Cirrosporium novae-zelandiae]|nr:MAG: hypothetical protein M1834_004593 [Cirrosporium novae-zelandiae]
MASPSPTKSSPAAPLAPLPGIDDGVLPRYPDNTTPEDSSKVYDLEKSSAIPDNDFTVNAFGDEDGAETKYRTMKWWQAGMLMIAETVSMGILALPHSFAVLGLIPGIILTVVCGLLATYTGYMIGQFAFVYPGVHSMADAGQIFFGRWGKEFFGCAQLLFFVLVMGSHVQVFSIMMNVITNHGACTLAFSATGTVLSILLTLPRQLEKIAWISIPSCVSILAAVLTTMISVGVINPRQEPDSIATIDLFRSVSLKEGFLAVTNIVFAYAGHVAFFGFITELEDPQDYPKALYLLQGMDTSLYLISAIVIYWFVGNDVASPALGSAGKIMGKVAWGLAIPTIVIAGVVNGHVVCKYIYVRLFRNKKQYLHANTPFTMGIWTLLCIGFWTVAWLIASAVPIFEDLLGLTSSLFASWFTFGLCGFFWIALNLERAKGWRRGWGLGEHFGRKAGLWKSLMCVFNLFTIVIGAAVCVLGLYSTGSSIETDSKAAGKPFSCRDNSP